MYDSDKKRNICDSCNMTFWILNYLPLAGFPPLYFPQHPQAVLLDPVSTAVSIARPCCTTNCWCQSCSWRPLPRLAQCRASNVLFQWCLWTVWGQETSHNEGDYGHFEQQGETCKLTSKKRKYFKRTSGVHQGGTKLHLRALVYTFPRILL